jgi:hypothetical protein
MCSANGWASGGNIAARCVRCDSEADLTLMNGIRDRPIAGGHGSTLDENGGGIRGIGALVT